MKISVILPTYKPQAYLWQCLESLASQTLSKEFYEVIIVLNGCNEPYYTEIKSFITRYSQVNWKFYQTSTPGVSNARNFAIDKSQGEFVTFIDDDDYISSEYLSLLLRCAKSDTISICNPWMFKDGLPGERLDHPLSRIYESYAKEVQLPYMVAHKFFSGPCMKLFPSRYIKGYYFDTRFKNGEDTLYMFLISKKFKYVSFAPHDAIYYRRYREGSAMTTKRPYWVNFSNNLKEIGVYIQYYIKSPTSYNLNLFIRRCLGGVYCGILNKQ